MSPDEASGLGCIVFDNVEVAWTFAELTFAVHEKLSGSLVCFNPFSAGDEGYAEDRIGRIYSIVDYAFGTIFGQGPDVRFGNDLFLQAATFCEHLANDHVFTDGNKRTALVMTAVVLNLKGVAFSFFDSADPEKNEAYGLIREVVAGGKSTEELSESFRRYARLS